MTGSILLVSVRPRVVKILDETATTMQCVREAAQLQATALQDPRTQKAIEAGIETLAVYNASGRLINRQVIPRAMKAIDEFEAAVATMNRLIANTDNSINTALIPGIAEAARTLNVSVDSVGKALVEISEKGNMTLDDIRTIMSDPSWKEALASLAATAKNAEAVSQDFKATSASVAQAAAELPSIAKSTEKLASTASKYKKALILVQILAVITAAVI
jgi:hypothetical protein